MYFLPKNKLVIQGEGGIKYVHKTDTEKEGGGSANADKADIGGRRVGEMLTMADKGGRGAVEKC